MTVIDEIKQKVDIVEVVGQYVKLTKSGRTMRAPCPFHSEKKPSFFVYPEQQTWHCFGACNTGGDVFSFIMKKEGLEFGDAMRLLAEKTGVAIPSQARFEAEDKARDKIYQINQAAAQYYENLLLNSGAAAKARDYLKSRGLNEKSLASFQLGYSLPGWESLKQYLLDKGFAEIDQLEAGLLIKSEDKGRTHDRFRDHLMFPIADDRGRVTGFGARVLDPAFDGPKYINSPQTRIFDKSGSLYGIHLAKGAIRQNDLAVLVEGYMDVIMAHQYGFSNVIAPMGVAITERQIGQIKKITRNIALALDPDTAGEEATMRCIGYENALDTDVKVITLPSGRDPDEVIKENSHNWETAVAKAVPVIEYTIGIVTSKMDLKTSAGKTAAVNKILPIIAEVKSGPRQFQYLTKLALAVGIEEKKLEAALSRYQNDRLAHETRPQALQKATRIIRSNPVEEYLLAILLQYPKMKASSNAVSSEYFENSENRAIFDICHLSSEGPVIPALVDETLKEHYDALLQRPLPGEEIELRFNDCALRLRERYLRNQKKRQEEALALAAESGDLAALLAKNAEIGTDVNEQLKKIFESGVGYTAQQQSAESAKQKKR
jgi:DNA primase